MTGLAAFLFVLAVGVALLLALIVVLLRQDTNTPDTLLTLYVARMQNHLTVLNAPRLLMRESVAEFGRSLGDLQRAFAGMGK